MVRAMPESVCFLRPAKSAVRLRHVTIGIYRHLSEARTPRGKSVDAAWSPTDGLQLREQAAFLQRNKARACHRKNLLEHSLSCSGRALCGMLLGMALQTFTESSGSHSDEHDVEAQDFFEEPLGDHPHAHFSGRAPWLRAGVLGANDGGLPRPAHKY